jgi:D-arabinose 1-dehydrogenase-like Zn-dependent alcohol dehydrogenase
MTTMRAAVVPKLGAKLEIQQLDVPEPGPGQVLVKTCFDEVLAGHVPARLVFTF